MRDDTIKEVLKRSEIANIVNAAWPVGLFKKAMAKMHVKGFTRYSKDEIIHIKNYQEQYTNT